MESSVPRQIIDSGLWRVLSPANRLSQLLLDFRAVAGALGAQAAKCVPEFTDHSLRHMDALWQVADSIFTQEEIDRFSPDEAFILGCSFYLHDLGMAIAATPSGLKTIQESNEYSTTFARLTAIGIVDSRANVLSTQLASRHYHAEAAYKLVKDPLPGLDRYLIADCDDRSAWAQSIGDVSASHHWDLKDLNARLGRRGITPTSAGGQADLGFLGAALRLIDYAHINRERASHLDRALRSEISADSLLHWLAQSDINGPLRQNGWLVYSSSQPISNIDAWWLFYELASGLDSEIRAVRDYLAERVVSQGRLTLRGVRGVESAETFSELIQLGGNIAPIDVRIQPSSMERLVEILGGKALYGSDELAPIRELLQNAADAVLLRHATNDAQGWRGVINVAKWTKDAETWISVADNGVGMSKTVMTRHLVGVASDFWHSVEFFRDFGRSLDSGFKPIGRFGIGFLSVFMIGDAVEVESEGINGQRFLLRLRGVGRRGELIECPSTGHRGTVVRLRLLPSAHARLENIVEIVRSRVPMLSVPIIV